MPFVSKAQERACWARYRQRVLSGKKIDWDCNEWARHTDHENLPERLGEKRQRKVKKLNKKSVIKSLNKKGVKIYTGKRGGKYIIKSGNKVYI